MKSYFILTSIIYLTLSLYAGEGSLSKVDEIKQIQKEEKQAKAIKKLLEYDTVEVEVSIESDIQAVESYKEEILDKLGPNKECYIVAEQIRQNKLKIEKYEKYEKSELSKFEIEKAQISIEKAKKNCPNYLKFKKGDK
jgi:hypothetical protein